MAAETTSNRKRDTKCRMWEHCGPRQQSTCIGLSDSTSPKAASIPPRQTKSQGGRSAPKATLGASLLRLQFVAPFRCLLRFPPTFVELNDPRSGLLQGGTFVRGNC